METGKIKIEPKFFHLAFDYANYALFNELLAKVDETKYKNNEKLSILYRFYHAMNNYPDKFDMLFDSYKTTIDRLHINLNGSYWNNNAVTKCLQFMDGYYATMHGLSGNFKQVFNYLLSRSDVDINKKCRKYGFPALQTYIIGQEEKQLNMGIVNALLNKGAKINACDSKGNNVLHYVIKSCFIKENVFNWLLFSSGINIEKKNKEGKTPLDVAEEEIVEETKAYDKAVKDPSPYWLYKPTKERIELATKTRDLIKARILGGI